MLATHSSYRLSLWSLILLICIHEESSCSSSSVLFFLPTHILAGGITRDSSCSDCFFHEPFCICIAPFYSGKSSSGWASSRRRCIAMCATINKSRSQRSQRSQILKHLRSIAWHFLHLWRFLSWWSKRVIVVGATFPSLLATIVASRPWHNTFWSHVKAVPCWYLLVNPCWYNPTSSFDLKYFRIGHLPLLHWEYWISLWKEGKLELLDVSP